MILAKTFREKKYIYSYLTNLSFSNNLSEISYIYLTMELSELGGRTTVITNAKIETMGTILTMNANDMDFFC